MKTRLTLLLAGSAIATTAIVGASCCLRKGPPALVVSPTTSTIAGGGIFSSSKLGIRLDYPAGWTPRPSKDYELLLRPVNAPDAGEPSITLDVPELPFHLPGMIPLRLVKNGYVDDLKKAVGVPIQTREESPTVAGVEARLLLSTWDKEGKSFTDTAIVMVHDDRVYILRVASPAIDAPATRAVFDQIAKSIQWIK